MIKHFSKISKFFFVIILVSLWIFSGWPQIGNFPPKIKEAQAATCATPGFGTNGGSFNNDTSSTLTISGSCSVICYTKDGTTPTAPTAGTCSGGTTQTYSTAVGITATGTVLKAIGTKSGSTNSAVATSSAFTLTVANPAFGTNGGSFNNDTSSTQTSTTTGAVFCYTVDGTTTPAATTAGTCSTGSTGATATVIATGKTIKVLATKANYVNSAVQTSSAFTLTVANPAFGTNGGSFNNDTSSTQTSTTTGAVFCQTVDGTTSPAASTPGTCSVGSTGAIATVIATGKTIKVLGTKTNYVNSAVQTSNAFTLTVGVITSSPGAGTYSTGTQSVTLSIATTTSAVAHYTTDGSAVSCSSTTYAGAFNVLTTSTVKAIGCKTNYVDDTAISDLYTITPVATPAFDNGTANYNNDVSVTITVASPASSVICYTTNGDTPAATTPGTCSTGTTYSGPVNITATGTVLKAIGTKANYPNSAVQSATYTLTVGTITSSPGAGTYTSTQSVTLNIATTTSAVAHYTTDGSAVSCSSTTYSGAFNVLTTSTVKAIGCKTNYVSDTAISDLYTLNLNTAPSFSGNPTDSPDPVVAGYNVTFSGTANDSESNNWYLAVCKTNSVTPGTPPTCASSQTLCVSSSAVGTGSQNTCTWTSTGSGAQAWYAFACDNNASPACSSANTTNSPVTVSAVVVSASVSPTLNNYGTLAINEVRKADTANTNDEFVVTNTGNVPEDFDIVSSDAVGGVGWTLSPTATGSSIFMHAYSTLKTLTASFSLGSNPATEWVALDKDPTYKALASNVAVSGTVDFILELLSPSGMSDYGVSKDITVTIRATQH